MKTILVDAVGTFVNDGQINQPLHQLLDQYPNRKIILTNANDEQIISFGLVNLPYELYTLKHNPDKTDPNYFREMLLNFNLAPSDVIYFEHSPEAIVSAQSVGITSHFYDSATPNLETLKQFLDSNL